MSDKSLLQLVNCAFRLHLATSLGYVHIDTSLLSPSTRIRVPRKTSLHYNGCHSFGQCVRVTDLETWTRTRVYVNTALAMSIQLTDSPERLCELFGSDWFITEL